MDAENAFHKNKTYQNERNMQVINNHYKINLLEKLRFLVWIVSFTLAGVSFSLHSVSAAENKPALKIAVASNFLYPMKFLRTDFHARSDVKIKITAGSTAKLYAHVINGAPFDVFLSADRLTPKRLVKHNLALSNVAFQYAKGQLVLWSVNTKIASPAALQQRLLKGDFARLALANPKTAPYGRAAMQVLTHYSVNTTRAKLILGESVSQAYQFTSSGNVDMGFVALSQLRSQATSKPLSHHFPQQETNRSQLRYWLVPATTYEPILQYGVILKKTKHAAAAEEFVHYLQSPRVQKILKDKFGYL